jgi:hypothetical protein
MRPLAVVSQSPTEPIDATSPDCRARSVNADEVSCVPWSERRDAAAFGLPQGSSGAVSDGRPRGSNRAFTFTVTPGGPGATLVLDVSGLTFNETVLEGEITL